MSVTLYGYWRSLAAFRVRAALNMKEIPYTEKLIDLSQGEQFSEKFDQINPQHVVPVLEHADEKITQSSAILEYLEEQWPTKPLLPKDAASRAYVRSLAQMTIADSHPLIVPRVRRYLNNHHQLDDDQQTQWCKHWLNEGAKAIEKRLQSQASDKKFACSNSMSIADIALTSHVIGARFFKLDLSQTPRLVQIAENCLAIPEIAKAHPLKQPGAPESI